MPTLDWIGKGAVVGHHRKVPYHLLRCDRELSAGDPEAGNLLVHGACAPPGGSVVWGYCWRDTLRGKGAVLRDVPSRRAASVVRDDQCRHRLGCKTVQDGGIPRGKVGRAGRFDRVEIDRWVRTRGG